ncbi:MAG: AraC family transcriptional regulator, partial [Leptospiraceae bacterium]|nr:AraC family transcriptional regulator [Leptospiraceae bacterium]
LNDYLGTNFYSYLAQFRIREACEMLRSEQERTILSIAYACGFNSKSSFHSAFKKELGMSPGEFRRSNQKANSDRSR